MRCLILVFLLFTSSYTFSQSLKIGALIPELSRNAEIEGIVYDGENEKEPLIFAEVIVKETNITTETAIDGSFKLNLKPGKYSLIFSFIGYKSIEIIDLEVTSNSTLKLDQVLNALKIDTFISEINTISKVR